MSGARTEATVTAGVEAVHREAAGVIQLRTVMKADLVSLVASAMLGHRDADDLLRLIGQLQDQIDEAPAGQPVLCATCETAIRGKPAGYAVVSPAADGASKSIGFAVCQKCGPTRDKVEAAGLKAAGAFWDLRAITVAPGGRA